MIKVGGQFLTGFPPEHYGEYILGVYAASSTEAWMIARRELNMPHLEPVIHGVDDMDNWHEMRRCGIKLAFPDSFNSRGERYTF